MAVGHHNTELFTREASVSRFPDDRDPFLPADEWESRRSSGPAKQCCPARRSRSASLPRSHRPASRPRGDPDSRPPGAPLVTTMSSAMNPTSGIGDLRAIRTAQRFEARRKFVSRALCNGCRLTIRRRIRFMARLGNSSGRRRTRRRTERIRDRAPMRTKVAMNVVGAGEFHAAFRAVRSGVAGIRLANGRRTKNPDFGRCFEMSGGSPAM